jgi:hypothetical protein
MEMDFCVVFCAQGCQEEICDIIIEMVYSLKVNLDLMTAMGIKLKIQGLPLVPLLSSKLQ